MKQQDEFTNLNPKGNHLKVYPQDEDSSKMEEYQQQFEENRHRQDKQTHLIRVKKQVNGSQILIINQQQKLTRFFLQILFFAVFLSIFIWGYFVTTEQSSWKAIGETKNIQLYISNCFVNVSQADDSLLQFSYKAKGTLLNQVNGKDNFLIAGIQNQSNAYLTFTNPSEDIRSCVIDLRVPEIINNLHILCVEKSNCVLAFGQDKLSVTNRFNATSEPKAQMQINIRNIVTRRFIYHSYSSGNLFLNHFQITRADIRMLSGDIVLQSTQSFYLNYTSQSDSICFSGYQIVEETQKNDEQCDTCFEQVSVCEYKFKNNSNARRRRQLQDDNIDENGGGDPIDENGGGDPIDENGGGDPIDENGGDPIDENGGGDPIDENGGGDPIDENGGDPIDENGGDPNDENWMRLIMEETIILITIIIIMVELLIQMEVKVNFKQIQILLILNQMKQILLPMIINVRIQKIKQLIQLVIQVQFMLMVYLRKGYWYYVGEVFQNQTFGFNEESIEKIKDFINKSGSADIAVRLDVDGHYLLQQSYSSYWTFFSNPNFADFSPWWLSTFSGTLLSPNFAHLQLSTSPGLCPWYPSLSSRQAHQIQKLIQSTFNYSVGEAIFIEPDLKYCKHENIIYIIEYETMLNFEELEEDQKVMILDKMHLYLGLNETQYTIVITFLQDLFKGTLAQKFPFSSLLLIYLLTQMRDVKQNEYDKIVRYIKGTQCINQAFIIFERFSYFSNKNNLSQFNKVGLTKLFSMGLFDCTELRNSSQSINYQRLEGLLYPGLMELIDQSQFSTFYIFRKKIQQNFQLNVNQYQNDLNDYLTNYQICNNFWSKLFEDQYQQNPLAQLPEQLQNAPLKQKLSDFYLEQIQRSQQNQKQLQVIFQCALYLSEIDISQYSFIRSKYWDKSLDLLKKHMLNPGEQSQFAEDQKCQQASSRFLGLLQYYSNQYTFSYQQNGQDKKVENNNTYREQLLAYLLDNKKPRIFNKIKKNKQRELCPINQLIKQFLQISLSDHEISEYKYLLDILYNLKFMDLSFISTQWGQKNQIMNTILMILIRVQLENKRGQGKFVYFAKMIPSKYLYLSLGDNYIDLQKQEKKTLEDNSNILNIGLDLMLDNCQEFSKNQTEVLKLMTRCFLGDVEAWYFYFEKLRGYNKVNLDNLSEKILRSIILELLIQLKNQGYRSQNLEKEYFASQTFYQLLNDLHGFDLIKSISSLTEKACAQFQQLKKINRVYDIASFVQFILNPNAIDLQSQQYSLDLIVKNIYITFRKQKRNRYQNDEEEIERLQSIVQRLFQFLFNIQYENHKKLEFKNENQILKWSLAESFMQVYNSKSLGQFMINMKKLLNEQKVNEFDDYSKLFTSYLCLTNIFYEIENVSYDEQIQIISFSFNWFYKLINKRQEIFYEEIQIVKDPIVFDNYLQFQESRKRRGFLETLVKLKKSFESSDMKKIKQILLKIEQDIFNLKEMPAIIRVILSSLALIVLQIYDQDQISKLMEDFVNQLRFQNQNNDQSDKKSVINKLFINFRQITKPSDLMEKNLKEIVLKIFSGEDKKIEPIIEILFNYLQDQQKYSLSELPLKLAEFCIGQNINDPNIPVKDFFYAINEINKKFLNQQKQNQCNEKFLIELVKFVYTIVLSKSQNKEEKYALNDILRCIDAIIAIQNRKFDEINQDFFISLGFQNGKEIIQILSDFQMSLEAPQKLIKEKMISFINPEICKTMQYMNSVIAKLDDNRELKYEDMFKVIDKNGKRIVQATEILQFLKRINIEITQHKLTEILVNVKKEKVTLQLCQVDFYEFKELMDQLSQQTVLLCLYYMGISKPFLFWSFMVSITYFSIVLAFILIGVKAFAIPGTFASIVNALLPILGGTGINRKSFEDKAKLLNVVNLKEHIMKAIKVLQSKRT